MGLRLLVILLVSTTLVACTASQGGSSPTARGKLVSLESGVELPLEYCCAHSIANGREIAAENPATGELFLGTYMVIRNTQSSTGQITNTWGFNTGQIKTTSSSTMIKGILRSGQGTVIEVSLDNCNTKTTCYGEATDNKGGRYQVYRFPVQ